MQTTSPDLKTPLYEDHVKRGARMAPFAGWMMPIQYAGIVQEHLHTRTQASLFDICHMGEFVLSGPQALQDLDRLVTQRLDNLDCGQCRYGFLLQENGGVLDDLTVYRIEANRFMLVVNAATAATDAAWINQHVSSSTVFEDISAQTAKIDIQGPTSRACLEEALERDVPELKYFRFASWTFEGQSGWISRTGYTGEWGYELYLPADCAVPVWTRLLEHPGVAPAGLGARDTLRLEVGYPLYGHELSHEATPVGVTGGKFMYLDKDFIGRDAVRRDVENGPAERLTGLLLQTKQAAREGARVLAGEEEVGRVTSGAPSPSLGPAIAMALVQPGFETEGRTLDVEVRNKRLPAVTANLPFYTQGTARGPQAPR